MLAIEYGSVGMGVQHHKYACSTMSSETLSESCGSRNNRIRTVRLVRPPNGPLPPPGLSYRHGPSLGFSIRGGREHATGIFVSHVEVGSEAHVQGLRVGDQIIRVNGFSVDDAVHKEVLQLISSHIHLTLKVRGVGMIPVKDKKTDGLSWQIITDMSSPTRGSPQLEDKLNDVGINIMVAPKNKLGCGICKGPEWKPGIFVQFTKEGGIAREAGLQPGDQILHCNNVDFSDIPFNEAVNLMKSSRQLNLTVRKGAGSELFPGESSGYNSSSSSVTGDQSPLWSDSKRLSIVKEESLELGERLHYLDKCKNINKWESWNDVEHDDKPLFKPTIINLSENGTTIHNNGSDVPVIEEYSSSASISSNNCNNNNNAKYKNSTNSNRTGENKAETFYKQDTKTVVVEVHKATPKERNENGHLALAKSASTSSFCSLASKSSCASSTTSDITNISNITNFSLSSAITLEIQRRQRNTLSKTCSIDEQLQKKKILKGIDSDKQNQHSKLMNEFKKAHQRMFKNSEPDSSDNATSNQPSCNEERLNNINNNNKLSQKLSERLTDLQNRLAEDTTRLTVNKSNEAGSPPPPPPPPPQQAESINSCLISTPSSSSTPSTRSNTLKLNNTKQAPPVPVKYSVLSYKSQQNDFQKSNTFKGYGYTQSIRPPPCPTPDYDTISLASTTSSSLVASKTPSNQEEPNDSAEMESLESFRINNPINVKPKPPGTYFQKRNVNGNQTGSGTSTIRRSRPVSITIGEYPTMRKQPGKLDFIQNGHGQDQVNPGDLGNRLTSELTQTLNRSNLKKRTESMENLLGDSGRAQIKTQRNGAVRISLSGLSKAFAKSTSNLTDDCHDHYETMSQNNRVTINVNLTKSEPPNGILKNVDYTSVDGHKTIAMQKSITFGEMPTLIKDRPTTKA